MKFILLLLTNVLAYNINIINTPFDKGANMKGSSKAFKVLKPNLSTSNLKINKIVNIDCNSKHITEIFDDVYVKTLNNLNLDKFTLQIGGDHSISLFQVFLQ